MKYNKLFRERICELMSEFSYSSEDVADKSGVAIGQVESYRKGEIIPSGVILATLGDLFNVSIDYLMGRTTARMVCDPADIAYRKIARYEIHERTLNRIAKLFLYDKKDCERLDAALYQDVKRMNKEKQNDDV